MRRESFRSVEEYQAPEKQKTHNSANKNKKQSNRHIQNLFFSSIKNRKFLHVAIILAVLFTATVGTYAAPKKSTVSHKKNSNLANNGSNNQSILAAGSVLAEKSKNFIAGDIKQQSANMGSQVILATAGDNFLAKTQPLTTNTIPNQDIVSYKVKNGDNLENLAKKFGVTIDTLRWANGLSEKDEPKVDQEIVVLPIKGILHTVEDGETLEILSTKYRANATLIENYNSIASGEALEKGRKVLIPQDSKNNAPLLANQDTPAGIGYDSNDTSLTSYSGSGANGYSYGYCTWYVASRRAVPSSWGNARSWYSSAQASGFKVGSTPVPGAIAWTGVGYAGHVAYVEKVENGQVLVSEMNYNGGWGRRSSRWVSPGAFRYIY